MSIETVVAIAVPLIALAFTAMTFKKNADKDTGATAAERATMTADIRYIRSSIDEIKIDNRTIKHDVGELKTKVVEIVASANNAHKRIHDLMKKG